MRSFLLLAPAVLASPVVKRYDLDGNGTPDYCKELGNGIAECALPDWSWTTIPSTKSATAAEPPAATSIVHVAETTKPVVVSSAATTTSAAAASPSQIQPAAGSLPSDAATFKSDKGSKWTMDLVPGTDTKQNLGSGAVFSNSINRLGWDKGRTSSIDGKVFWNFGDCSSVDGLDKDPAAGFSMGAAFYAGDGNPLEVNTEGLTGVNGISFANPWTGSPDPDPVPAQGFNYGMDTSNTAQVAAGKGIAFAWEIFRGGPGNNPDSQDNGAAFVEVTLGDKYPIANRTRSLITDKSKIQVGLMTVFNPNLKNSPNAGGYLYMYSSGNSTWDSIIVGRVKTEFAFDVTKYQFMKMDGTWDQEGVIPNAGDTSYGMQGKPVSHNQGSIMWNDYLQKYMLFVGIFGGSGNFHTADAPWGPWSSAYELITASDGQLHYGSNVHPDLLPSSNGKELYWSWGTPGIQTMYKITFNY